MTKEAAENLLKELLRLAAHCQGWQDVKPLRRKYKGNTHVFARAGFFLAAVRFIGKDTKSLNLLASIINRSRSTLFRYYKLEGLKEVSRIRNYIINNYEENK